MYRVSSKRVYAFAFKISWLPRGLENPSWAIFNSPFCLDFENVQFVIFWFNLDRDIGKILHFLSISQLPLSLEISSWAIFNSPFCVDFENVQFVNFRFNLDEDIGKILQGGDFKS